MSLDQPIIVAIVSYKSVYTFDRFMEGYEEISRLFKLETNVDVRLVMWEDTNVKWDEFDAILVLGVHDYIHKPVKFLGWLDMIDTLQLPLYNSTSVIRWNMEKRYLLKMEDFGIKIPETILMERDDCKNIDSIIQERGWSDVVVKPTIGCDSFGVQKFNLATDSESLIEHCENLIKRGDILVQKFMPSVTTGEIGVYVFSGKYAYGIKKIPVDAADMSKGVVVSSWESDDRFISKAQQIYEAGKTLSHTDEELLYARVDMVLDESTNEIMLMELELIEPILHYKKAKESIGELVLEIMKLVKSRQANR